MSAPGAELYPIPGEYRLYDFHSRDQYLNLEKWFLVANGVDVLKYKTQQKQAFATGASTIASLASVVTKLENLESGPIITGPAFTRTGIASEAWDRLATTRNRWAITASSKGTALTTDENLGRFQPLAVRLEQVLQVYNNVFQEKMAELRASTILSGLVDPYLSAAVEGGLSSGTTIALP